MRIHCDHRLGERKRSMKTSVLPNLGDALPPGYCCTSFIITGAPKSKQINDTFLLGWTLNSQPAMFLHACSHKLSRMLPNMYVCMYVCMYFFLLEWVCTMLLWRSTRPLASCVIPFRSSPQSCSLLVRWKPAPLGEELPPVFPLVGQAP